MKQSFYNFTVAQTAGSFKSERAASLHFHKVSNFTQHLLRFIQVRGLLRTRAFPPAHNHALLLGLQTFSRPLADLF